LTDSSKDLGAGKGGDVMDVEKDRNSSRSFPLRVSSSSGF